MKHELKLERNPAKFSDFDRGVVGPGIIMTPRISSDYWTYRVRLSEKQAILGFEKFFTIGIGFEHEADWNTNLPWDYDECNIKTIFNYIKRNKGDRHISNADCMAAIQLIQVAVKEDKRHESEREIDSFRDAKGC